MSCGSVSFMERRYAPYGKWLGTAFAGLECAGILGGPIERALSARDHVEREQGLAAAYEAAARIYDPDLRRLPLVGAVDQFVDSTDVLSHRDRPRRLRAVFDGE
jgi:hypothetical protein